MAGRPITTLRKLTQTIEAGEEAASAFGEALRAARRYVGITQTDLASVYGVTPAHLSHLELGDRRPSAASARRLLDTIMSFESSGNQTVKALVRERAGRPRKS